MGTGKTVTAIVCTRGITEYLPETLQALAKSTRQPDRVIVVDISPTDATPGSGSRDYRKQNAQSEESSIEALYGLHGTELDRIKQLAKRLLGELETHIIHIPGAAGFGAAVNEAYRQVIKRDAAADAGLLWLLHDDSAPEPECLERLIDRVVFGSAIAAIGSKQVAWDNPEVLVSVGITATRGGRRLTDVEDGEIDQGQYDTTEDVLAIGTAGMLVRSDVFSALGGFDPAAGIFGEALEFGRRMRLAGYRVLFEPQARIRHRQASRRGLRPYGLDSDRRVRQEQIYARRYNRSLTLATGAGSAWAIWIFLGALATTITDLFTDRRKYIGANWRATMRILSSHGAITRGRRRISSSAVMRQKDLRELEASRADMRRHLNIEAKAAREMGGLELPEPVAAANLRAHRARERAGALLLLLFGLVTTLFALRHGLAATAAGGVDAARGFADMSLPGSFRDLWQTAWAAWTPSGDGVAGRPPLALVPLTLFAAPFALFRITPDVALTWIFVILCAVQAVSAQRVATVMTYRVRSRVAFALLWQAGVLWLASTVTVPLFALALLWFIWGIAVASGRYRPLTVAAAEGTYTLPGSRGYRISTAVAAFGLFGMASINILSAMVALLGALIVTRPRFSYRPLLAGFGTAILAAPTLLDPGRVFESALPVAPWLNRWGVFPRTVDRSLFDMIPLPVKVTVAVFVLLVVAALLHPAWRVRAAWLVLLGGIVTAAVSQVVAGSVTLAAIIAAVCGWLLILVFLIDRLPGRVSLAAVTVFIVIGAAGSVAAASLAPVASAAEGNPVSAAAALSQASEKRTRVLAVAEGQDGTLDAELLRGPQGNLVDLPRNGVSRLSSDGERAASADLANLVAALALGNADIAAPLSEHGIEYVALRLTDSVAGEELLASFDTSPALTRVRDGDGYALWRVVSDRLPAGAQISRVSGPGTYNSDVIAVHGVPEGGQVRVAERAADGWRVVFNGERIPVSHDGWALSFTLPTGASGVTDINYVPWWLHYWQVASAVVLLVMFFEVLPVRSRRWDR